MNGITILIWITIALIGIIAIILVRLHYGGNELENDEGLIIPNSETINGLISQGKEKINSSAKSHGLSQQKTTQNTKSLYGNRPKTAPHYDVYIVPEEYENMKRFEYESENQVLINYGNEVKKFQEPIKQSQMDIMNQNKEEKTELKDLFTIDELIKESKRKDNERGKESQKDREEDAELAEIKESIKQRKEHKVEEPLIEEIVSESETIEDIVSEEDSSSEIADAISEEAEETPVEAEVPTTSQKDIEEVITSASKESEEEEIESISEDKNITDVLLSADNDDLDIPNEEIKEPTLKTPSKVGERKDYEFGAPIDDANLFDDNKNMDLDYRKDLDKITNKITGSRIFQDVKEKILPETEEVPQRDDESYIRSVNRYDEFEPIINETHIDYENMHDNYDQRLRQENTRRVFNMAKNSPEPELAQPKAGSIKEKPARDNIKITIGNAEFVLKKGDEIIFNHLGETYSSQVYGIHGDDISVKYRRQNITIKPEDVKKIY